MIQGPKNIAITCRFDVPFEFQVFFTEGAFDPDNDLVREVLRSGGERRERLLAVIDESVSAALPKLTDDLTAYLG